MNSGITGLTLGILLAIVGVAALFPALLDYTNGDPNYMAFLKCSLVSLFFGCALIVGNYNFKADMNLRDTFMLTTLSWVLLSLFSAFPLYFSDLGLSFVDAFFESVSGITTTGSTVLHGLDEMSRGILLWRSITQWIGGIGIIAFAIVILPFLRIGGMQLFQTESSDRSEKIMPRTFTLVVSLLQIYVWLTVVCAFVFFVLGMSVFDAINHAMTTIPTGGYSTHDASFGYFDSAALQYAASFFMLAGGIPFVLYAKLFFQKRFDFFKDDQVRALLFLLTIFIFVLTTWLYRNSDYSFFESLRLCVFNIISVITTTGFATTDYTVWGGFSITFFLFLTYLGCCAGSTSGGVKAMRLIIAAKAVSFQIKKLIYPRAVFTMRYQGRAFSLDVMKNVLGFLGLFVVCNIVLTVSLTFMGLEFDTAVSGAATALANVGPGISDEIGPSGNFALLPDAAKWLLSAGMILGRLEIMTVFVLFQRDYWH